MLRVSTFNDETYDTLEAELTDAVRQKDEVALAAALCKFAEAVQRSLQLALQKQLLLDVRPANFASMQ